MSYKRIGLFIVLLLTACSGSTPTSVPVDIYVQYTPAAGPYIETLAACEGTNVVSAVVRPADYLEIPTIDMAIRVGQPLELTTPAYQVGTEEILVVVNRQNPINYLTGEQVLGLFTGRIQTWKDINDSDAMVQVWVFPRGDDIQQVFGQAALAGSPVTSFARLANSPDEMSQAIANDVNAVGILSRHWIAGDVSEVYIAATAPVLAITPAEPDAILQGILTCMQKENQ